MKRVFLSGFVFFFSFSAFGSSLVDAYNSRSIGTTLGAAHSFPSIRRGSMVFYEEVVGWADQKLIEHFSQIASEGKSLDVRHDFFADGEKGSRFRDLEIELGLLYYLSEHARSNELKRAFIPLAVGSRVGENVLATFRLLEGVDSLELEYHRRRYPNLFERIVRNLNEMGVLIDERSPYIWNVQIPETRKMIAEATLILEKYEGFLRWNATGGQNVLLVSKFCSKQLELLAKYHKDLSAEPQG